MRRLMMLLLALAMLAGLGGGAVSKPDPEIVVWSLWSGGEEDKFEVVLHAFTVKTGIEVKHVAQTSEGLKVTLPAAFGAGTTPADVVLMPWQGIIKDLAGAGHLTEVTDLIDEEEFAGPPDWVRVDGVLYGVPYKTGIWAGFWYIPSFFAEHGLAVPQTWGEFQTLLADIQAIPGVEAPIASGAGWPIGNFVDDFIVARGGVELYQELLRGERQWTDPQVKAVFQELLEMLQAGYFSVPADWAVQVDKFAAGKYALYVMGSWIVGMVPDPEDINFFGWPETQGIRGGIDFAIIPKYTGRLEEAQELARFLGTPYAQSIWAGLGGYTAPNLKVSTEIYPTLLERDMAEAVKGARLLEVSDTAIGGEFPVVYPDQLTRLWTDPTQATLDEVLEAIQASMP